MGNSCALLTVDHSLVPHTTVSTKVFTGEELDPDTGETITIRVEETVLPEAEQVAGEDGNEPGVFMPVDPAVGDIFFQERIPGVTEERSTVIAIDRTVTTPAGTFAGCPQTEDIGLPDGPAELKSYCPGVCLVREDFPGGHIELVEFEGGA